MAMQFVIPALLVFLQGAPHGLDDELQLRAMPSVSTYPGTFRATATLVPDQQNRLLTLSIDGPTFFRSSTQSIDGADAARVYTMRFTDLPAGIYRLKVIVQRSDGKETERMLELHVVGPQIGR